MVLLVCYVICSQIITELDLAIRLILKDLATELVYH